MPRFGKLAVVGNGAQHAHMSYLGKQRSAVPLPALLLPLVCVGPTVSLSGFIRLGVFKIGVAMASLSAAAAVLQYQDPENGGNCQTAREGTLQKVSMQTGRKGTRGHCPCKQPGAWDLVPHGGFAPTATITPLDGVLSLRLAGRAGHATD